ncbi:hypothetical protein Fcan01_27521 [Folsomia candida]|uniref:Uncharacterized protein n=1 Tax=Folsomia candida TaxID=158441 RepID=A0A226CY47_FOLCA|nr:hypothetical protein Fcan01_27521 [Folsomia candida]
MRLIFSILISLIFSLFVSPAITDSEEEDDAAWFSFSSSEENQELSRNQSKVKKSTSPKVLRWDRAGLCDHDVFTSVMLKLILDAQDKMTAGDNSTGLMPLDPIFIPEIVIDPEKMRNSGSDGDEDSSSKIRGTFSDIYIKDLSKFNVTGINFDLPNMFLNVSLVFESVTISGTGCLKAGPLQLPIFGKGKFLFKLRNVNTFISANFGTHANETRYLKDFDYGLTLKTLHADLTPPLRAVVGLDRMWNPFARMTSGLRAKIFNRLEQMLHPPLRERGSQEISKRMGV